MATFDDYDFSDYDPDDFLDLGDPTSFNTGGLTLPNIPGLPTGGASSGGNLAQLLALLGGGAVRHQQAKAFKDMSDQFLGMGAPYREQLQTLTNDPMSFLNSPAVQGAVQQGTDTLARSLSMGGNPIGSGNALQALQSFSTNEQLNRLGAERDRLSRMGGLESFNAAVPSSMINAINSQASQYDALGPLLGLLLGQQSGGGGGTPGTGGTSGGGRVIGAPGIPSEDGAGTDIYGVPGGIGGETVIDAPYFDPVGGAGEFGVDGLGAGGAMDMGGSGDIFAGGGGEAGSAAAGGASAAGPSMAGPLAAIASLVAMDYFSDNTWPELDAMSKATGDIQGAFNTAGPMALVNLAMQETGMTQQQALNPANIRRWFQSLTPAQIARLRQGGGDIQRYLDAQNAGWRSD
jgi:hypothetical protein